MTKKFTFGKSGHWWPLKIEGLSKGILLLFSHPSDILLTKRNRVQGVVMPSPFPGMNPYLEQTDVWEDFHNSYLRELRDNLSQQVGEKYFVKLEVRVYLQLLDREDRWMLGKGDIGIVSDPGKETFAPVAPAIMNAPLLLESPIYEEQKDLSVEILDRKTRRVVTVIELLSPSNKTVGKDYESYQAKRTRLFSSRTHFVEIDLLRGGHRADQPALPECDYYTLIHHAHRPKIGFWPIPLRSPLPTIPIPLDSPDSDIPVELQTLLHRAYDAARYDKYIYEGQPEPLLKGEDAQWAKALIPS
jgi:hypothetical protein